MKQREKTMALVLIGLMTVVLGGLLYFQYYSGQMRSLDNRLSALNDDNFKEDMSLMELSKAMPRLKLAQKLSLPADVDLSKREYSKLLNKLLSESGFYGTPSVKLKQTEMRATTSAAKRPPFTKLTFDVRATGDLNELIDFLEKFYRTPLLHRITRLTVTRPLTSTSTSRRSRDADSLDILLTIEAMILEGAEKRNTLIAADLKEEQLPKSLARTTSQYAMIAGNNVFYGPYVKPIEIIDSGAPEPKKDSRFLANIRFNEITNDERGTKAELYDEYYRNFYVIRKRPYATSYRVDTYIQVKDRKIRDQIGEEKLVIKDDNGLVYHTFKVLRIDLADMYLEEDGKPYRLHFGNMMSQVEKLTDSQAKELGLPQTSPKESEKKASARKESASQEDIKEVAAPSDKKTVEK